MHKPLQEVASVLRALDEICEELDRIVTMVSTFDLHFEGPNVVVGYKISVFNEYGQVSRIDHECVAERMNELAEGYLQVSRIAAQERFRCQIAKPLVSLRSREMVDMRGDAPNSEFDMLGSY